ncbi:MAG: carboxypeptidase regulatory-like domain-containing protein [Methylotenera sp.]|nr:carboxypeptidase regulatory-like domain-containing protein [Oligoflexia bacterium]
MLLTTSAFAYTPTLTTGGAQVKWSGRARIPFAGNPANRSGIDPDSFFQAVVHGLQRWQSASGGATTFDYWQGTDPKVYLPNSEYNGLSSIYFASNSGTHLPSNVLGLTQVWYNTTTGQVIETDIVLNDKSYRFTTDPRDTSGYGTIRPGADGRNVFIENVLTHEMGHAFGLSHSGGLQSTMLFMESPEQAYLGCDEQVGIHAIYPSGDAGKRGALQGKVVSQANQAPVFGAHVLAISRTRGTVLATALTDAAGNYTIAGLEPGSYYLMAEPFFAGASALPTYYAGMNTKVCAGETFGRTVLTGPNKNRPTEMQVNPGAATAAPVLVADCTRTGGASVSAEADTASETKAPVIYEGAGSGFGASGEFSTAGEMYFKLKNVSGRVEIHALAYSLYSPVSPSLKLLNSAGTVVAVSRAEPVYSGASGFTNYDSAILADKLEPGNYTVQISSSKLNASQYPAGPIALDATQFLLLTGSVNESTPLLSSSLALNARCRMNEAFAAYTSPPGPPERTQVQAQKEEDRVGFCGTVENTDSGGDSRGGPGGGSGHHGPGPAAIAGWCLPWLFMFSSRRWLTRARTPAFG